MRYVSVPGLLGRRFTAALALSFIVLFAIGAAAQEAPPTPEEVERDLGNYLDQKIENYILNHPEVIITALRAYQDQQRRAEEQKVKGTIQSRRDELFKDPGSPVGGNPDGDVTLVEFFDYNCPYCRRVVPVMKELQEKDPQVRIVYKEFPVLGPVSVFASRAALAAREQDKYLPFHDALMQIDDRLTEEMVMTAAKQVGLDIDKLKKDMANPALNDILARNRALADELSVSGTPSFVVGDNFLGGAASLATIEDLVAQARQTAQQ